MGRQPCCKKIGLKRGPWTIEEDHRLMSFILNNGIQCWRMVPKLAGLLRCGKSCRLRWINYLRPDLKRGILSEAEENQIIELHASLGNRWSKIASHFPGRTDNEIKNHWNTRIKKRLKLQGLDPLTHKPIEHKENVEEKIKLDNGPNFEEKVTGQIRPVIENAQIPSQDDNQTNQTEDMIASSGSESNSSNHLINNYEMMGRNHDLDMDLFWMTNQGTNCHPISYSPSFSLEDSVSYPESTVSIEGGNGNNNMQQYWVNVDQSVDSLLSWDGIDKLDQNLLFSEIIRQ